MFSESTYIRRRQLLSNQFKSGILLFLGNIENPINFEHNPYPFRQDSTFLYFFGVQQAQLAAIMDIDEGKTIVFGNESSIDDIIWMGQLESLQDKCLKSGVREVRPYQELFSYITHAISLKRDIHYLPPYQPSNKILLSQLFGINTTEIRASVPFIKAVVALRERKEELEIREIEKAVNITNDMHRMAIRMAQPGMKEYHLANAIQKFAADSECGLSYPPIVTVRGEVLHNHFRSNTLEVGKMILNDSGVETSEGYAGDITRTFPIEKTFSSVQKEIYQIVLQAFEASQSLLKPGLNYKQIHLQAATSLVEGLKDLGLMKGNIEEAVRNHAHTLFFQCGVGHMMGLDVHDMEDLGEQYVGYTADEPKDTHTFGLKSLRLGKPLQEGFVVTVEPGIYFIPELIDLWKSEKKNLDFINYDKVEEFKHFGGIRIEDNFLITASGYRLLGNGLEKTISEIENLRQS